MKRLAAWIGQLNWSRWPSQWPWRAFVFIGALWALFWVGHPNQRLMARTNDVATPVPARERALAEAPATDCEGETIQVKLNPVCPRMGEDGAMAALETARHPILAIELREYPKDSLVAHSRISREHFMAAAGLPIPGLRSEPSSEVVATVDLNKENLVTAQFQKEMELRYNPAIGKRMLAVLVCDDLNRNGRCSDEKLSRQIAVRSPIHEACLLPRQIPIAVRAGCP